MPARLRRAHGSPTNRRRSIDVLCVSSAGGHLLQMHLLREAWHGLTCAWVTHDAEDARSILATDDVTYAYGPTTRNVVNLIRNLGLAWRLVTRLRPRAIVSTGAGIAVPFAWIGRLRGIRVIYIESMTRVDGPSMSCRLIAPVADRVYVQWPELARTVRGGRYAGNVAGAK